MKNFVYALFALALVSSGCRTNKCKDRTVFVDVTLAGITTSSITIDVTADGSIVSKTIAIPTGDTTGGIEIDFPNGYEAGKTVTVAVSTTDGEGAFFTASRTVALSHGCTSIELALAATNPDLSGADMTGADMRASDLGDRGDMSIDLGMGDLGFADDMKLVPPDLANVDLYMCMSNGLACAHHTCGPAYDNCGNLVSCGQCELYTLTPTYSFDNRTVDIEGSFDERVVVNFPGGVAVNAEPQSGGSHRVRVNVPSNAGRGMLTVTTNTITTNALPFSHTTYQSLLGRFSRNYPQTSVARVAPSLTTPRALAGSAVVGGAVYVVGGTNGTTPLTSVERATINADGTLGAFKASSIALNTARSGHRVIVLGNMLHVIGGASTSGAVPLAIESAPIAADGTLGSFVPGSTTLLARYGAAVVAAGQWLYVIGGAGNNTIRTIERAPIGVGGTLGAFGFYTPPNAATELALPDDFVSAQAFVTGRTLTVVGGCNKSQAYTVELDGNGNITGQFQLASNALPSDACGAAFVRIDGSAYLVGGADTDVAAGGNGSSAHDNVLVTSADQDGPATKFQASTGSSVPDLRMDAVGFSTSSAFYVCGGVDGTDTYLTTCTVAQANTSGGIAGFAAISLGTPGNGGSVFAAGSYVYLVGTSSPNILRAQVTNDVLGAFSSAGITLSVQRTSPSVLVAGDDVYVYGGNVTGDATNVIEHGALDANGVLTMPSSTGAPLAVARMNATTAWVGGDVYVDGGKATSTGAAIATRDAAPASPGTLGGFTKYNGGSASTGSAGLVLDETWYILTPGGVVDSATLSGTALASMAQYDAGPYPLLVDRASVRVGPRWYVLGGADPTATPSTAIESFPLDTGVPAAGAQLSSGLANAVTGGEAITIGNSLYVLDASNPQAAQLR